MSSPAPTPIWKIALIPALLLVFAGILWKNFSSNTDSDVPELLVPANFTKTRADSSWKVGRKEVAITFNPFRELKPIQPDIAASEINGLLDSPSSEHVANSPSNAEASNSSDPLQALSSQPVTLLIKKGKKDIAVIGDQIIHSGQRLESGHEVRSIDIDRILLSNPNDPSGETLISPPKSRSTVGN